MIEPEGSQCSLLLDETDGKQYSARRPDSTHSSSSDSGITEEPPMLPPKQISPSRKYNSGSLPSTAPSQKSGNKTGSPNMTLVCGEPANENYRIEQTIHQRTHSHDLQMKNGREDHNSHKKAEEHPVGHCRTRSNPIVQSFSTVKQTFKNLHRPSSASATQNSLSNSVANQMVDSRVESRRSSVSTCKIKNPGVRLLYTLGRKGKGDGCLTRNDINIIAIDFPRVHFVNFTTEISIENIESLKALQ